MRTTIKLALLSLTTTAVISVLYTLSILVTKIDYPQGISKDIVEGIPKIAAFTCSFDISILTSIAIMLKRKWTSKKLTSSAGLIAILTGIIIGVFGSNIAILSMSAFIVPEIIQLIGIAIFVSSIPTIALLVRVNNLL